MLGKRVDPSYLSSLSGLTDNIRNFCILAHVDHGKTTLSDSLVCSNAIISPKLAGKLRFLDSTEEEQRRGITMHSSAISLLFRPEEKAKAVEQGSSSAEQTPSIDIVAKQEEYLINLVDSPGHIDFSSDVSTATRLCDGALIVIDVLEGLCTQTHAVLYKALKERMIPCLVLNKIDRLAIEMKLTPTEAFSHLRRIVENVNALAFSLLTSELRLIAELEGRDPSVELDEDTDPFVKQWNFSPEKGNVIFASAIDCWAFSITKFSNIWSKKLAINKNVLQKYFFDYYSFNAKTKKIVKCDPADATSKPMFATMILEPIWQLYEAAVIQQDPDKAAKMAHRGLNVEILPREINLRDPRSTVQAIFRKWLPLPDALLRMVVRAMPSPKAAQAIRISNLLANPRQLSVKPTNMISSIASEYGSIRNHMCKVYDEVISCDISSDSDVTVFISKMTPARVGDLSSRDVQMLKNRAEQKCKDSASSGENNVLSADAASYDASYDAMSEVFMALGRVFSGVLSREKDLYILGNRHDPFLLTESEFSTLVTSNHENNSDFSGDSKLQSVKKLAAGSFGLYLCLGPSVYPVNEVYAGNIVGIVGLDEHVLKTGTLSTTWKTLPMNAITFQAKPMVRVALEPTSHYDLPKLQNGLQSLYQYDPVVEVGLDDNGQYTMTCLGELHLELCLKTLIDKFAKCDIKASEPLVSFRETIITSEVTVSHTKNIAFSSSTSGIPLSSWLPPPWNDTLNLDQSCNGRYRLVVSSGNVAITFRCFPLPFQSVKTIENESLQFSGLIESLPIIKGRTKLIDSSRSLNENITLAQVSASALWFKFYKAMLDEASENEQVVLDSVLASMEDKGMDVFNRILAFGPNNINTNMLIFDPDVVINVWSSFPPKAVDKTSQAESADNFLLSKIRFSENKDIFFKLWLRIHSAVVAGFQFVTAAGVIMNEPLHAVGYAIESIEYSYSSISSDLPVDDLIQINKTLALDVNEDILHDFSNSFANNTTIPSNIMIGQLISEVKDSLRLCVLSCSMRVVEPVYECELQCDQSQLGNLYSVLTKRRGEVIKEDIIDGTSLFLLSATLPVNESFGFAQELLKKTSGNGTAPQLKFSHWQIMDLDPFWKPKTEDELEEFGESNTSEINKVRILVDKIRKRKGLAIEEKVVEFAEKQRTLKK